MHLTPWQILAWLDKDKNLPFPQGGGTEMKTRKLPPQPLLHLWIFCPITFTPHTTSQLVKRNWGICSSETAPSPDRVLSLNKSSYLLSFPPLWILSVMKQNLLSRNNFKGAWLLTLKHFYSCLENPMDGGAWWAAVHGVAKSRRQLSDFTFIFHFHALEKEMAIHSSVLAWRIPGTGEPHGLLSMGSHRVGQDWSNLAAAILKVMQIELCVFWCRTSLNW